MRRASTLLVSHLQRGVLGATEQAVTAGCSAAACSHQQLRFLAAGGHAPEIKPNPLQQIVPPIIKGVGQAVDGLKSGAAALVGGLTDSGASRAAVTYFADKVLLSGTFVPPEQLDLAKWSAWLAANGYSNKAGWDTLLEQIKAKAADFAPSDIEALVPALEAVGRYDKDLYKTFADTVKARFTEFETAGLAQIIPIFSGHDLFDADLWDDAADSITYCNHYMAPNKVPLTHIAALFAAYAKYEVNRGDLFVSLARCIHEDRLKELDNDTLKTVAGSLLKSFKDLSFYPDCTEAIILAGRVRPGAFGPAESALAEEVESELRGHAPEGKLPWLDGGWQDPEHFHGGAFGSFNLWVARDELLPQYYSPSDISPRPASMTLATPEPGQSSSASASS